MPRAPAPAPAITGDVIRIAALVIADSEQCLFSLDYMSGGFAPSPALDAGSLLSQWATINAPIIKAILPADAMYNGAYAYFLSRQDVATGFSTTGNGVGLIVGNHLDKQLAARFAKLSVLKGAHGRGALLFGPLSTTFVTPGTDANRLNAAGLLAMGTLATSLKNPITVALGSGNTFSPCVSTRPPVGTSVVTHAQNLVNITVNSILSVVRRRRLGRGV